MRRSNESGSGEARCGVSDRNMASCLHRCVKGFTVDVVGRRRESGRSTCWDSIILLDGRGVVDMDMEPWQ